MKTHDTARGLLIEPGNDYPGGYLHSRLVPRMARLAGREGGSSWSTRRQNITWSYRQLSCNLRRKLEPLYLYVELPMLMTAIRLNLAGQQQGASDTLGASLWNYNVQSCVINSRTIEELSANLPALLAEHNWHINAEPQQDSHPLRLLERDLFLGLFSKMTAQKTSGIIKETCGTLIDLFNLSRCTFPPVRADDPWSPGGHLRAHLMRSPRELRQAFRKQYRAPLHDGDNLGQALLRTHSLKLYRCQRAGQQAERAVAYLWGQMTTAPLQPHDLSLPEGAV